MSQEKVDYHKQQKQNMKKMVKQKKRQRAALIAASVIVIAVLGTWVGFSVHTKYQEYKAANPTYYDIDLSALSDYISSLQN